MFSTLASLLLASQAGPAEGVWLCRNDLDTEAGYYGVEHRLDANGRLASEELHWVPNGEAHGSSAHFIVRDARRWRLTTTWLGGWTGLSRAPRGPLRAIVRVGGRIIGQRPFGRPRDLPPDRRLDRPIQIGFPPDSPGADDRVPQVGAATEVVVTLEEQGGAVIARQTVPMPDWPTARRRIAEARPLLARDAADYRNRCRDTRIPLVVAPPTP